MNSRPWMKWFPGDWRRDAGVQSCSLAARGLWEEMLWIMYEAPERGYLVLRPGVSLEPDLARLVGSTPDEVDELKEQLELKGIYSRDERGIIFSRRMVHDHLISEKRSAAGRKGGNPALLNQPPNPLDKQTPDPRAPVRGETRQRTEDRVQKKSPEPPKPPTGGKRRVRTDTKKKQTRVKQNTELMVRIGKWFNRGEKTLWSLYEAEALERLMPIGGGEVAVLEAYYTAEISEGDDFRRRNLETLLNNWPGERDRAAAWKKQSKKGGKFW